MSIFHEKSILEELNLALIVQWTKEHKFQPKVPKLRIIHPPVINRDIPWEFFDGATQGSLALSSVGAALHLNQEKKFLIIFLPGHGSKNKAELDALWEVLFVENNKDITNLQCFGNSKVVVDWAL